MGSYDTGSDSRENMEEQSALEERMDQRSEASENAGLVVEAGSADAGALVGSYVSIETPGVKRAIVGKVTSYNRGSGLYTVVCEDGNREDLDHLQISKIVIADDDRAGSNMKLSCRKRKLDLLVSSGSVDLMVPPPRTRSRKNAPNASDGAETSSHSKLDSDLSEDADSSSNSCDYAQAPSVASPEFHSLELPPSSGDIAVPEESISYLFSVYSFLRSFSVQLFLSPFGLDDFVGSLNCTVQNSLLDAIHLSLMRALRRHLQVLSSEGLDLATKCLRHYDWSLLDALTWHAFVVEYLYMMGYMKSLGGKGNGCMLSDGEYYGLPVSTKLKVLQILCDDVIDSAELRTELEMRENMDDDVEGDNEVSLPLECGPRNVQSSSCKNSTCKSVYALQEPMAPPKQMPSPKLTEPDADASCAEDGNSDECQLCGMDGTLICCDGCPSAYHSRCIGLNKAFLPTGPWFCPECIVDKLGPTSFKVGRGIKGAVAFGVDVCGRIFLGTCNYLLVIGMSPNALAFARYYSQTDVTKLLSLMSPFGEIASSYAHICNEISKYWEIPASSLEAGHTKPIGGNHIYIDRESSVDDAARAHSSVLNSVNQCGFPDMEESNTANCNVATKKELASHEILPSPNNELLSSNISRETVRKIFPGTHIRSSKQFGNESIMTTMSFSNLPSAGQRSTTPDISSCISTNENGRCRVDAGSSYVSNKNNTVDLSDRSSHGNQFSVVQGRNDGATNSRSSFNPQSYVNLYIHGDIAASAAANLAALTTEEKRFSEVHVSSNSRKTVAANVALQMKAFSGATMYFLWPTFEKKLMDIPRERCGWCIACKGSITNKKGCFLNLAATNAIKGSARNINSLRPTKHHETHFPVIAAHMANMEERLRGLIVGSLLGAEYNLQWRKQVREASSCRALKILLLELERNIRGIAFLGAWSKLVNDGPFKFSTAFIGTSRTGPNQKRGPGRRSKKLFVSAESVLASSEDSWKDVQWWRGGKLSKVILQNGTLPSSLVRKAARQGGFKRIPSICYPESVDLPRRSRQFAWRAAVQMCKNASQLALQVRYLDAHIRWKDLVPPEQISLDGKGSDVDASAFRNVVICDKRFAENKLFYALTFRNQKHIPLRVMKNVLEKEIINDENSKLWFSESHIPLYLIKEYEEEIGGKLLPGSMPLGSHAFPKFRKKQVKSRRRDIFSYLLHKGDKPSIISCSSCKEDVNLRDATTCSICQGKCHMDCAIPLIDRNGANLAYNITCKICYHAKTAALNASCKEILNTQPPLRRQDQLISGNKFMLQITAPQTAAPCGKVEVHQGIRSLVSSSKAEGNIKRAACHSYGLMWKRQKDNDAAKDFRLENIIMKIKEGINPSIRPTCCLCNTAYRSDLMYISCEKCHKWYHADALKLEEAQIFDLVGFKCCRCRRKASPKCPYVNPNNKKPESQPVDNGNTLEGSMSDLSILAHSSNLVLHSVNQDLAVVNGDPLLHSFGIVEPLPAQTLQTEVDLEESKSVHQSQQKLSVRRPLVKHAHQLDDHNFSKANDEIFANSSGMVTSYNIQESGGCGAVSDNNTDYGYEWHNQMCGSIEEAEYEPQTYFSFTELLASDGQLDVISDDHMNVVEIGWPSNRGEIRSHEAAAIDGLELEAVNSAGEELVIKETAFHGVACDICKLDQPSPDLNCEICGQRIHSHCSPWDESEGPSSDANWRCGRCRDWR